MPKQPRDKQKFPQPKGLPARDDILKFIAGSEGPIGKREISRAFGIKGNDKIKLKSLLKDMKGDGSVAGKKRRMNVAGELPPVTVIEVVGVDDNGDAYGHPVEWHDDKPPKLLIEALGAKAPAVGDRVLAKIEHLWTRPLAAMTELAVLQTRQHGSMLFDLPAFRDLLLLGAMARELAEEHAESSPADSSDIDLTLPITATARHDNRAAVRQALAARVTGSQALPPELMSHLLTPAAHGADEGGLDLDLSDATPGPREFIRPATFTDVEKRGDGRHSEMSDFDSLEPPSRTRR